MTKVHILSLFTNQCGRSGSGWIRVFFTGSGSGSGFDSPDPDLDPDPGQNEN